MTIREQKNRINQLLGEEPKEDGIRHIRKNDGLFERKRMECSKVLITEDNKQLLND